MSAWRQPLPIFLRRVGKIDSVDVQCELDARTIVASGRDIVAPSELIRTGGLREVHNRTGTSPPSRGTPEGRNDDT